MGCVFDISRTSLNDGPGVRTVVFLKGCPLRCKWCHNPEGYEFCPQLFFFEERCICCGRCESVCPNGCHDIKGAEHIYISENCAACGKCENSCTAGALSLKGREMTAEEIIDIVLKDRNYYASTGGGMTLSGGEPLAQPEFAFSLLASAKSLGIHSCIETSGFCSSNVYSRIVELTDLILFDCKGVDNDKHIKNTGVSNEIIHKNLQLTEKAGKMVILRCPLVPGLNDSEYDLSSLAEFANRYNCITRIEIMPYHNFGVHKIKRMGRALNIIDRPNAAKEDKERWRKVFEAICLKPFAIL